MDGQAVISRIVGAYRQGDASEALTLAQSAARAFPDNYQIVGLLAQILERTGRTEDAAAAYGRMTDISPGTAFPFTKRATLLLRQQWGPPPSPRPANGRDKVVMSTLGSNGRFGNQILQYIILRIYAHIHALDYETSDWIGRDLFGLNDPYISSPLPFRDEAEINLQEILRGEEKGPHNVDLRGYFGKSVTDFWRYEDLIRDALSLSPPMQALRHQQMERIGKDGTIIAIHIRRGDFGYGEFWLAPVEWYLNWLAGLWDKTENPVLYIASDDREVVNHFRKYAPLTAHDMPKPPPGIEFITDYLMLASSHVMAMANSTFSYSSAFINERSSSFYKPSESMKSLIPCDPWDGNISFF